MITCTPSPYAGVMDLTGITPNGTSLVVRKVAGQADFVLRGGDAVISTGGFALVDTEAPFGVPLTYSATISGISSADRLVQQNLMLTPTFLHGVQGWLAGTGRTLTIEADSRAHSAAGIGHITGTATTTTPTTPPTLIGHKDTAVTVSGSYTLDPATPSGGGAIATNDWMLIIHTQLALASNPADPAGWTRIDDLTANNHRQIIWKRKRAGGDTSYTVAASSGAQSLGSLLWVRGSGDTLTLSATATPAAPHFDRVLSTNRHAVIHPSLVVSIFSASATLGQRAAHTTTARILATGGVDQHGAVVGAHATITAAGSGTGPLSSATMAYMVNSVTLSPRTLIIGTNSQVDATDSPVVAATYGSGLAMGFATQVAFHVNDVLTNRIISRAKADLIPATTDDQPHLLTGRVRFLHPGLWTWQDVKDQGTWQNLKDTKPTWLDVRGSSSTVAGDFLNLFVQIVDGSGNDLVPPQRVLLGLDVGVNQWLDFAMLFSNAIDIPTTAEVRLVHGSSLKEFGIDWYLDEFGITPGAQRVDRAPLYWFDGDSPVPAEPEDLMFPDESWDAVSSDASVTWAGTVGNSVSELRMASSVRAVTTCRLDTPVGTPCEPVLLSDPVNVNQAIWCTLLPFDDLTHPSNRALYRVLDRAAPVDISQLRGDEQGTLALQTYTLAERDQLKLVLQSGRVLLMRIPDPSYPESAWYLSLGDLTESRIFPDQRRPERLWSVPYARVERPVGLIEAAGAETWADVLALGTWSDVLADRDNWLEVLVGEDV